MELLHTNAANEATDRCVWTFDVVGPKVHQNNRSYVSSADLPSDSEFSMVGGYTENPEKPQNCQNWGVGTARVWALARTIRYYN